MPRLGGQSAKELRTGKIRLGSSRHVGGSNEVTQNSIIELLMSLCDISNFVSLLVGRDKSTRAHALQTCSTYTHSSQTAILAVPAIKVCVLRSWPRRMNKVEVAIATP